MKRHRLALVFISFSLGDGKSGIPVFTFFPVQYEGFFSYLDYKILIYDIKSDALQPKSTLKYINAVFPKHLFRGLKYLCRIWLMRLTNPYWGH